MTPSPLHHFLCDAGCEPFLLDELARACPAGRHEILSERWVTSDLPLASDSAEAATSPLLVFSRQCLPQASEQSQPSIGAWSQALLTAMLGVLPDGQPWRLHLVPLYGEGAAAGLHRCELIRQSLRERLKKVRRSLLRSWEDSTEPLSASHSLVQLVLTAPDHGLLSVAAAPQPQLCRGIISAHPLGELPVAVDKAAPARAFAKLVEAEQRLGHRISAGERVVDLGASPGSWSYVAIERGAHVIAVDRSPLREDLMRHPRLSFHSADAFKFKPEALPVDWLICDVIAAPERSIELLLRWVRERWARKFILTIKFKGQAEYALLDELKRELPPLCSELGLTRLCANKNEACAFGVVG